MKERSYIAECLSPILRAFRDAFPDVKYEWIERDVKSIKEIEVSGPPYKSTERHTVDDAKKLLMMAVCSLCRILADNLDCPIEYAKKVRTFSIQSVGKGAEKILSFISSADDNTKDLREWIHLLDDDLTPVTDNDMDELSL
ncbi:hypothetical protein GLOIN_2v1787785 [Rhizophagus clarus]|uniref:Uncharacterized protein n=1 Tax=Rhizophagus clarus TaxID=94130 RepID=A0A8H3L6M4_9GLOM|nr:hypothetical protein GLOIN_2v1787785 [Rhizophagus clarus]